MKKNISAMAGGLLFGLGLAISQMINPEKVLAFLDITGNWDPSLVLVLASATGVTMAGFHTILQYPHPVYESRFHLPKKRDIDLPLVLGAAIFGIGWGMAGYCPGPAIAALTIAGNQESFIFVISILAGSYLYNWVLKVTNVSILSNR